MRFANIKMRGLGPYRGEVELDLENLDAQLVAVTGDNGAGKSTLLSLLTGGALYREARVKRRSSKSLTTLATARDAVLEATVINGARYIVRHLVDAVSGKGESLVLDEAGQPQTPDAKVRSFDAWARDHFPSPEVLYTGPVAVQGDGGFLDLSRAERGKAFLRYLGLERFERMAELAREKAREAKATFGALRARLEDECRRAPRVDEAEADLGTAREAVDVYTARVRNAEQALEQAKGAAEDAQRARELRTRRVQVEKRLEAAKSESTELDNRIVNNRNLLLRAGEIREAQAHDTCLAEELAELEKQAGAIAAQHRAAQGARAMTEDAKRVAEREVRAARDAVDRANARLAKREAIEQAASEAERYRAEVARLRVALEGLRDVEQHTQAELVQVKDLRIGHLRGGLVDIFNGDSSDLQALAADTLEDDEQRAEAAVQAPAKLKTIREQVAGMERNIEEKRGLLAHAEALAAQAEQLAAAQEDLERGIAAAADGETRVAQAVEKLEEIAAEISDLQQRGGALGERRSEIVCTRQGLAARLNLLPRLEAAEARIEELEPQLEAATKREREAETELQALPVLDVETIDLDALQVELDRERALERDAHARVARAEQALENARASAQRLDELRAEIDVATQELEDWTRLGQDLGKDGLQALEIDAAIPEVNELCNDLLANCHGPRWTVELRSDRLSADGKRVLEGLDVRVIDTQQGLDQDAEDYSGGEAVICGEAVALALTMLACQRNGIEGPTLIRDETGAALDPQNGRAYVAMLRRAAQIVGASQVLYVSHTPELQELADARIVIKDGRVEVQA